MPLEKSRAKVTSRGGARAPIHHARTRPPGATHHCGRHSPTRLAGEPQGEHRCGTRAMHSSGVAGRASSLPLRTWRRIWKRWRRAFSVACCCGERKGCRCPHAEARAHSRQRTRWPRAWRPQLRCLDAQAPCATGRGRRTVRRGAGQARNAQEREPHLQRALNNLLHAERRMAINKVNGESRPITAAAPAGGHGGGWL